MPQYLRNRGEIKKEDFFSLSLFQFIILMFFSFLFWLVELRFIALILFLSSFSIFTIQLNNISLILNFKANTIAYITSSIINVLLMIAAFLLTTKSLEVILSILVIKEVVIISILVVSLKIKVTRPQIIWFKIIQSGFVPLLVTALITLNYKLDVIMLKWLNVESSLVGIYAVGVSIAEYTWIFSDIFKDVLLNENTRKTNVSLTSASIRFSFTSTFIMFILLLLTGRFIIPFLFGSDFTTSYPIMLLMFGGVFFISYLKLIGTIFQVEGKWTLYLKILTVSVFVSILLNTLLIPIWGMYGAAIGTVISYAVSGLYSLYWYCKNYEIPFIDHFLVLPKDIKLIKHTLKSKGVIP